MADVSGALGNTVNSIGGVLDAFGIDNKFGRVGNQFFEVAGKLRDEIRILKKELRSMEEAGV
jgi:hypothetical protein